MATFSLRRQRKDPGEARVGPALREAFPAESGGELALFDQDGALALQDGDRIVELVDPLELACAACEGRSLRCAACLNRVRYTSWRGERDKQRSREEVEQRHEVLAALVAAEERLHEELAAVSQQRASVEAEAADAEERARTLRAERDELRKHTHSCQRFLRASERDSAKLTELVRDEYTITGQLRAKVEEVALRTSVLHEGDFAKLPGVDASEGGLARLAETCAGLQARLRGLRRRVKPDGDEREVRLDG